MKQIERINPEEAAEHMNTTPQTIRLGLQQGRFPWGYAIKTSGQWTYIINKQNLLKMEGLI